MVVTWGSVATGLLVLASCPENEAEDSDRATTSRPFSGSRIRVRNGISFRISSEPALNNEIRCTVSSGLLPGSTISSALRR